LDPVERIDVVDDARERQIVPEVVAVVPDRVRAGDQVTDEGWRVAPLREPDPVLTRLAARRRRAEGQHEGSQCAYRCPSEESPHLAFLPESDVPPRKSTAGVDQRKSLGP